jgi:hypothetical protein
MEKPAKVRKTAKEFHEAIGKSCIPRIERATVPILGVQHDIIVHDRTGVLYQCGDHHFVLTAAHDLKEIVQNKIPLYLAPNVQGAEILPLGDARFISTETDDRDIGIVWLPPALAADVKKHRQFVFHNQVNLNPIKNRTPYLFFGFPKDWSGFVFELDHVVSKGLAFSTFAYEGNLNPTAVFRPEIHMALDFDRKAVAALAGTQHDLPVLNGVSGCGVWQVGDRTRDGLRVRTPETVTLIGIQHSWYPESKYVKATRIGYALRLINEYFPETRAPMSLAYPPGGA